LRDDVVMITVQFTDLTLPGSVVYGALSHLYLWSCPSGDVATNAPSAVLGGLGEVSVDYKIVVGSLLDEGD
jgi:hypothetical protein